MTDPAVPELSDEALVIETIERAGHSIFFDRDFNPLDAKRRREALRSELLRRLQESHALRLAVAAYEEGMAGVVTERNGLREAVKELRAALCCIFGPEWPTDEQQERAETLYERTRGSE